MALFKPFRGNRTSLDAQPLHDGYAYFCIDDGSFHIDYVDADGNLQRKQINAKDAEMLCGMTLEEIKQSLGAIIDVESLPEGDIVSASLNLEGTMYNHGDVYNSDGNTVNIYVLDTLPETGKAYLDNSDYYIYLLKTDDRVVQYLYNQSWFESPLNIPIYYSADEVPSGATGYILCRRAKLESVNENAIYRVAELGFVMNGQYVANGSVVDGMAVNIIAFDTLPDISELTPSETTYYIQTSDNTAWIYPNSEQGLLNFADIVGDSWGGVVSSKDQATDATKLYAVCKPKLYHYKNGWHEIGGDDFIQPDWTQTDETASDYIKNKPTLGALASKDAIGLIYDEENESLSIEYGVHLAPGEEEAVPVTEMRVNQIVDESVTASEERMTALIEEAINGALEGEY